MSKWSRSREREIEYVMKAEQELAKIQRIYDERKSMTFGEFQESVVVAKLAFLHADHMVFMAECEKIYRRDLTILSVLSVAVAVVCEVIRVLYRVM